MQIIIYGFKHSVSYIWTHIKKLNNKVNFVSTFIWKNKNATFRPNGLFVYASPQTDRSALALFLFLIIQITRKSLPVKLQ